MDIDDLLKFVIRLFFKHFYSHRSNFCICLDCWQVSMRLAYISHRRGMSIVFPGMIVIIKSAKSVSVAIFAMCLTDKLHFFAFPEG